MRRHPDGTALALYAGGELGLLHRVRLAWHMLRCGACRREAERFREARLALRDAGGGLPAGLDWERLEAEMRANIRLGVAAGAIVRRDNGRRRVGRPVRKPALVVVATLAVVAVAGLLLERSRSRQPAPAAAASVELRPTAEGLAVDWGQGGSAVLGAGRAPVAAAVSWDGSVRAPFVDEDTGQVTIYNVAAQ